MIHEDRELYFFLFDGSADGEFARECPVLTSFDGAVKDIATSEIENITRVLRGAIGEKLEDVSEDIARAALAYLDRHDLLFDDFGDYKLPASIMNMLNNAEEIVEEIKANMISSAEHVRIELEVVRT